MTLNKTVEFAGAYLFGVAFLVYVTDLWMMFDSLGFFYEIFVTTMAYNTYDYTRMVSVFMMNIPLILYRSLGGNNFELSIIIHNIGLSWHYFLPLIFIYKLSKKKLVNEREGKRYVVYYLISFTLMRTISLFWYINELNASFSVAWCIIAAYKFLEQNKKKYLFMAFLVFCLVLTYPYSLLFFLTVILVMLIKKELKYIELFLLGSIGSVVAYIDYNKIHKYKIEGATIDGITTFLSSDIVIFQIVSYVLLLLISKRNFKYIGGLLLILGLVLVSYVEIEGYIFYYGRLYAMVLISIVFLLYLGSDKFNVNFEKIINPRNFLLGAATIHVFITLTAGNMWLKDKSKLSKVLDTRSGIIKYTEVLKEIKHYANYANSWTQRILSFVIRLRENKPVYSYVDHWDPKEQDVFYWDFEKALSSYYAVGGRVRMRFYLEKFKTLKNPTFQ